MLRSMYLQVCSTTVKLPISPKHYYLPTVGTSWDAWENSPVEYMEYCSLRSVDSVLHTYFGPLNVRTKPMRAIVEIRGYDS